MKASSECPECGCDESVLLWQTIADGRRHIREECALCGRYIRWAPQTAQAMAEATAGAQGQTGEWLPGLAP